jgi:hypothetical protein
MGKIKSSQYCLLVRDPPLTILFLHTIQLTVQGSSLPEWHGCATNCRRWGDTGPSQRCIELRVYCICICICIYAKPRNIPQVITFKVGSKLFLGGKSFDFKSYLRYCNQLLEQESENESIQARDYLVYESPKNTRNRQPRFCVTEAQSSPRLCTWDMQVTSLPSPVQKEKKKFHRKPALAACL